MLRLFQKHGGRAASSTAFPALSGGGLIKSAFRRQIGGVSTVGLQLRLYKTKAPDEDTITHDDLWKERFQEWLVWKQDNHGLYDEYPNATLKRWVEMQRRQSGKRYTPERHQLLQQNGFEFDPRVALWNQRFHELKEYQRKFGDTFVTQDYEKLGAWVRRQRFEYKKFQRDPESSCLTPERIERMNSIDFCWSPHDYVWDKKLNELKDHIERGQLPSHTKDKSLWVWIKMQSKLFVSRHADDRPSSFTDERIQKMKSVRFPWEDYAFGSK